MTADAYGGLDGEFPLASASSTPGVYQLQIANLGGGSFRVEENTQPEFEVSAIEPPIQPVRLGDKIRADDPSAPTPKTARRSPKAKVEYKVSVARAMLGPGILPTRGIGFMAAGIGGSATIGRGCLAGVVGAGRGAPLYGVATARRAAGSGRRS